MLSATEFETLYGSRKDVEALSLELE